MKFIEFFNKDWSINWERIENLSCFEQLSTTPQSETWHKEGNVLKHVHLVAEAAEKLLSEIERLPKGNEMWIKIMVAAICHDLGKANTTKWSDEKNDWSSKNHGVVGERITRKLFADEDILAREQVCYMVRHHMTLHHVLDDEVKTQTRLIKLSHGIVPIKWMLLLNEADSRGSINDIQTTEAITDRCNKIYKICAQLDCFEKQYPFINKSQLIRDFINYKGEVVNETNDFCVYILCGFPGCGKSTYIKNNLSDKVVISRDIIRAELGIGGASLDNEKKVVGTREEEDKVSKIFDERMIACCEKKESFVLDNTNLKYQYRKDYLLKVMKYNPKVKIIYIESPDFIHTCIQRRDGEIPSSVYKRMSDNFEFPQLYECDELVIVKQIHGDEDKVITFNGNSVP